MSISVVVSSTAAGVSVSGGTSVAITVGGGIGPAGFITAPGTATNAFGTFQLASGDGVTITTNAGQFVIASYSTTQAASFAPVQSVQSRTGAVVLSRADITAAAAVHTHSTADIVSFAAAAAAAAPVQGIVAGSNVTVTTSTSGIFTIAAEAGGGIGAAVESLNGQTGAVSIQSGANVTVSTAAGTITIAAPAPGDALPSQGGNANRVLGSNGTSASWVTRYSVVEPVLVAGTGLSFSKDTSAGSITIEANGGIVGSTAASVSTKSLSSSQNDYDAGVASIVRLTPSANVTLTGLAGGVDGVVRVLYNVGTHAVTLTSQSTASQATNRFVIVSGNVTLDEGDSSSVWYDGTSQRWRVLEDQVTGGSGGSGGGIAMSYLFG